MSFPYRLFDRHQIDPNQCTEYRNPRGCHSNNLLAHSTLRRFHQRFHGSTNHVPRKRCLKKKNKGDFTIIHTVANTTFFVQSIFKAFQGIQYQFRRENSYFKRFWIENGIFPSAHFFFKCAFFPMCAFFPSAHFFLSSHSAFLFQQNSSF